MTGPSIFAPEKIKTTLLMGMAADEGALALGKPRKTKTLANRQEQRSDAMAGTINLEMSIPELRQAFAAKEP
jgi:hypothetical protein